MAIISKPAAFRITAPGESAWPTLPTGQLVTVGNNRQVAQGIEPDGTRTLDCYLHGSRVVGASYSPKDGILRVDVDTCGYPTVTTRAAINDFLGALGVDAGASVAKKRLSVRAWGDVDVFHHNDEIATLTTAA